MLQFKGESCSVFSGAVVDLAEAYISVIMTKCVSVMYCFKV